MLWENHFLQILLRPYWTLTPSLNFVWPRTLGSVTWWHQREKCHHHKKEENKKTMNKTITGKNHRDQSPITKVKLARMIFIALSPKGSTKREPAFSSIHQCSAGQLSCWSIVCAAHPSCGIFHHPCGNFYLAIIKNMDNFMEFPETVYQFKKKWNRVKLCIPDRRRRTDGIAFKLLYD